MLKPHQIRRRRRPPPPLPTFAAKFGQGGSPPFYAQVYRSLPILAAKILVNEINDINNLNNLNNINNLNNLNNLYNLNNNISDIGESSEG